MHRSQIIISYSDTTTLRLRRFSKKSMICKPCNVTVDDLQSVDGSISCSCKSCVEFANHESAMTRLKLKRCKLKRNINRSHSPFIHMIPPEIIATISEFAITDFTIIGSLPDAILLSSDCSDWRRTVIGTRNFGHQ